ncbi:MAG: DUF2513 domain-containing protein [Rhodospirillales bacterium]
MKRDMELVRKILIDVQSRTDTIPRGLIIDGYDDAVVARHAEMLVESGLLKGNVSPRSSDTPYPTVIVQELSWEGHDFVDALETEGVWKTITSKFSAGEIASMPLSILKNVGMKLAEYYAMQKLGMTD